MDRAVYWRLKAKMVELAATEAAARRLVEQAQQLMQESGQKKITVMLEAGLDPKKNYMLDDVKEDVEEMAQGTPEEARSRTPPSLPAPSNLRANRSKISG